MFFGFRKFNLTMSETRYLNIESSNISLVGTYYRKNTAMNEVIIEMLFFGFRTCANQNEYYYPVNYSCLAACPASAIPTPPVTSAPQTYLLCKPCHYSCDSCNVGQDPNACIGGTCPVASHRTMVGGNSCPCNTGYADVGNVTCVICSEAIPGCVACTSATACQSCDNISYMLSPSAPTCICTTLHYAASGFCLSYSGCLQAIQFNNTLACLSCDTSLNYIRVLSNESCVCNEGFFLNTTAPECYDVCGDGITAMGKCDDGNTAYGDGCD
jgi:hypothetical protein